MIGDDHRGCCIEPRPIHGLDVEVPPSDSGWGSTLYGCYCLRMRMRRRRHIAWHLGTHSGTSRSVRGLCIAMFLTSPDLYLPRLILPRISYGWDLV